MNLKFTTVQEMQAAYVKYSKELFADGLSTIPTEFLQVMHEWEAEDGKPRIDDLDLARKFLYEAGYSANEIDEHLGAIWQAEYTANVSASIAMGEVDHTICLYYDEVITIEEALDNLRNELPAAKHARDAFFLRYGGKSILR